MRYISGVASGSNHSQHLTEHHDLLGDVMMADAKDTKTKRAQAEEKLRLKTAQAQARNVERIEKESEVPQQMFLPGMDEAMRAMPNHIARSSLFAPVAAGRKKIYKDAVLASRGDAVITFWGEQLDESQADVWLQAMYEAMQQPLGQPVVIKPAAFLRAIGRTDTGPNYKWLHQSMKALAFAMLVIEVQWAGAPKFVIGKTNALHMIDGFDYDDETEVYTLRIDPRWRGMYSNREFALIDWGKRLQFGRHQNMAKALQRLVATSADALQRYALDWLKSKLEYTGRQRDFEAALKNAMLELERLAIISGGKIETNTKGKLQTVWTRL
jgi:hypothetical protein